MEFFDGITFDIAKQKYYNANKVDARMEEIKAAFAELIEENNELRRQINDVGLSKERVAELIMGAQAKADEMIKDANAKAEEIINKAKLDADGIVVSRKASDGGEKNVYNKTKFLTDADCVYSIRHRVWKIKTD